MLQGETTIPPPPIQSFIHNFLGGGRVGGLENAQAVKLAIAGSESAKSAITSNRNEKSKIVFLSSATLDTVAR